MPRTRILSLDGGGSFAGLLAAALARVFDDKPGREIIREFDIVAGNSGGSIVMTALCCNYRPSEIAAFYADPDTVRAMFCPRWSSIFKSIAPLRVLFPPYSAKGKSKALNTLFDRKQGKEEQVPSTILMKDWPGVLEHRVRLLVTAYDYDRERAAFFRSFESRAQSSSPHVEPTLAEAVHASTNAPIYYYGRPAEFRAGRYWDGGLAGYNNPVLAAVIEALANDPGCRDDIRVLSIGTDARARVPSERGVPPPLGERRSSTCLAAAIRKAGLSILTDPPEAASFHAYVACGQPLPPDDTSDASIVRMCPHLRPELDAASGEWRLPKGLDEPTFSKLMKLPSDAMRRSELDLLVRMGQLWLDDKIPNQPIRAGKDMRCDIGDDRFSQALAHWRRIA